jgi:hypothetical protein
MIAIGAAVALFRTSNLARDRLIRLNPDVNLGALFELDLAAIVIDQPVRDTNLAVQVIGTLNRNLGLLRLAGVGVRIDHFFYFPWKNSSCLGFFGHHWEASTLRNAH